MLGQDLINSKIRFLESFLKGKEQIFEPNLFHSMLGNGKSCF